MKQTDYKIITILSVLLAIALAIVSFYGVFDASTYQRDAESIAVQGIGQDIVDLFLVVPVLIISLYFARKSAEKALMIHSGTVLYIVYSFVIYCFGVHFNNLFLWYCAVLGLSFYTFIVDIRLLNSLEINPQKNYPLKTMAFYFLIIALMFYGLWLKDVIPAIINNSLPVSVRDYNLLVNPVHVLDIALVLPGLVITAVLLLKKSKKGILFAPVFLVFIVLMAVALIAMVIMLKMKSLTDDSSVAGIFSILAVAGLILLGLFFKQNPTGSE